MVTETEILQKSGLFDGMTAEETEKMCVCLRGRRRNMERGEALWHTGDAVSACALVLRGRLRAEAVSETGDRRIAALHGPASLVGDVLMATAGRSPVDVLACEDTEVLLLPFARIMGGCERCCVCHVRLRENLLREIAGKFWAQRRRIAYLSEPSLRGRIAARLLDEARRTGSDTFSLHCTREELAELLGVNRSALSRELSRMAREGLIEVYRDSFRLLRRSDLAGFNSDCV